MVADTLDFADRVAIVTGAGGGLGRAHARLMASRGAKVIVNDVGLTDGALTAEIAARAIKEAGGTAVANTDSVAQGERIVEAALDHFGRIDIVVNNAGNLRDRAFHNMSDQEWDDVYQVHLLGTFKVTHAAWRRMREQSYGRVVCTSSGSGVYGSFGQANYAAAKMAIFGLVQTLALEGARYNIRINAIAPAAGSRLSETVWPADVVAALKPEFVSPLVAHLSHELCEESGALFEVGGGWIARLRWQRSAGVYFPPPGDHTPEDVARNWDEINDFTEASFPSTIVDAYLPLSRNMPDKAKKQWLDLIAGR